MGRPLLRVADLRRIEQAAQQDLPVGELMQRAGRAAARVVARIAASRAGQVVVLCGPGNNGGDGYACAAELRAAGGDAICWAPQAPASDDARAARLRYVDGGGAVITTLPSSSQRIAVVVDAMFGIGLARQLAGPYLHAAGWAGALAGPVVAVDVPSGIDADTGAWVGGCRGVNARCTITFLADKPGLHTFDGCDASGYVEVDTLGVDPQPSTLHLFDEVDAAAVDVARPRNSHKGTFGDAWIVGGGIGMVGAPLLAARAALRLGAGRVFVDCIGAPDLRIDPLQPELMFRPLAASSRADSLVVGCGLGTGIEAGAALEQALSLPVRVLVADADALNLLAGDGELRRRFAAHPATRVVTPHPLEAARLLQRDIAAVLADRVAAACELASTLRAIAVLKGAGTVVAAPDGRAGINASGSPALATPGSGDVLAGMIAALAARAPDVPAAVALGVWLHGAAADEHGSDCGLVAGEIAALASRVRSRLRERATATGR